MTRSTLEGWLSCFKCLRPATVVTPTGPMCAACFKAIALKKERKERDGRQEG
ncbi:MAG: hypothetical protein Q8O40_08010 [Chloroflexota bacterium]|nr:hypothetical protein [Chloroflexota bacterium]